MSRPLTITNNNVTRDTSIKQVDAGSILFDSDSDTLVVSSDSLFNFGSNDFTIEFWFRADRTAAERTANEILLILQGPDSNEGPILQISINGITDLLSFSTNNLSPALSHNTASAVTEDVWYHAALVRDGTYWRSYVNGVQLNSTSGAASLGVNFQVNIGHLYNSDFGGVSRNFRGRIDNIRISSVCRYPDGTTFTPSTSRFLDDLSTILLVEDDLSETFATDRYDPISAEIDFSTSLVADAETIKWVNPNLAIIDYTWDDLDVSWDDWYVLSSNEQYDLWNIEYAVDLSLANNFDLTAEATFAVIASSEISANFNIDIEVGLLVGGSSEISTETALSATALNLKIASATLACNFDQQTTAVATLDGRSDLAAEFDLAVSARNLKLADFYIENLATMSVTASLDIDGRAELATEFTQTQIAGLLVEVNEPYDYTWDGLPEDIWNGFPADRWGPQGFLAFENLTMTTGAGLAITGEANLEVETTAIIDAGLVKQGQSNLEIQTLLTCAAESVRPGQALLPSQFALTAIGSRTVSAQSSIDSQFTETATAGILFSADADLQDNFGFEISATAVRQDTVEITAQFAITASAGIVYDAAGEINTEFTTSTVGSVTRSASAELSILAFQIAEGISNPAIQAGVITLDTVASLAASAGIIHDAASGLAAEINQSSRAGIVYSADAELEVFGFQVADSRLSDVRASAEIASEFSLSADSRIFVGGSAELEVFGFQVADSRLSDVRGSSDLQSQFGIAVSGGVKFSTASAELEVFGFQLADGRISDVRGAANLQFAFTGQFEGDLKLLESGMILRIPSETRNLLVKSETRLQPILPETRVLEVER